MDMIIKLLKLSINKIERPKIVVQLFITSLLKE